MSNRNLYKRLVLRIIYLILSLIILFFAVPVIFSYFAPFIFALVVAALLNPFVSFFVRKFKAPRRLISFLAVFFVFLGVASLVTWFVYTIVAETISLQADIMAITDNISSSVEAVMSNLEHIIGLFPGDTEATVDGLINSLAEWFKSASGQFANNVLSGTKDATVKAGNVVIASIIFILSAYFLTADYPKLGESLKRFNGNYAYESLIAIKNSAKSAFGGYLKAQLILLFIAFSLMFTAFTISGQDYAALISLIIAIIDFFPFLGAGAVLLPWAVISIVVQNTIKAVFLVAVSVTLFLIRRFAEPKIMSTQIGLTPLAALVATYVGLRVAGVIGVILGPVVMVVLLGVIKTGIFDNAKKDIQELADVLAKSLRRGE
jgi:sporulation integral membrane protein YtvI